MTNYYGRAFKITKCSNEQRRFRDWSSLPIDVLRDISSRLLFEDYYSFANVCTRWRSAKGQSPRMPLVLLHQYCFLAEPKPRPFLKLINLADNLSDNFHMPILGGKVCIGSQHGWLIVEDKTVGVISLFNPFSQQVIELSSHAPLLVSHSGMLNVRKVALSSAPISSTAPLPAAAALLYRSPRVLYKRAGESCWKSLEQNLRFVDIIWWRGVFAGITCMGNVLALDINVPEPELEYIGSGFHDIITIIKCKKNLVNFDGNLLQVWWSIDSQCVQTRSNRFSTVKVMVMQLDFESRTWFPVDDLCGHSLFLSTSNSFALSSQHVPGLKDNLIYFIQDLWGTAWDPNICMTDWKRDIRVFNMRTGSYEICVLPNTPLFPSMFDDLCGHSTTSAFWYVTPLSELQNGSF